MKKKKPKNKLLSKFLRVFIVAFAILMVMVGIGATGYILVANNKGNSIVDLGNKDGQSDSDQDNGDGTNKSKLKKITTFAILGVDEDGYRTDVTMIAFFNKETKNIDLISVPRDTMIKLPDSIYSDIQSRRNDVDQIIKINEVPAYAEPSVRNETSVEVLESALGIDVDYYVSLNLEGFKSIVDLVGPIEVEIPFDMVYSDPLQNLYINLTAGVQEINGAQAEGLIRYRKGYATGDLGRIDMQHEFMKAFMSELLSVENKMNIVNIASTALLYVKTDFVDAVDYVNYIDDIYLENIRIHTLPGEADNTSRSFYIYDYEVTQNLLNEILSDDQSADDSIEVEDLKEDLIDVKTLSISVQNGTNITGFAARTKEYLEEQGYVVSEVTNYEGEDVPLQNTKLLVPSEMVGLELEEFFKNPEVQIDQSLLEQDMQVIILLGESDGV